MASSARRGWVEDEDLHPIGRAITVDCGEDHGVARNRGHQRSPAEQVGPAFRNSGGAADVANVLLMGALATGDDPHNLASKVGSVEPKH